MGQQVELTSQDKAEPPQPRWDDPRAAFSDYRAGMSPYVHVWLGRRPDDGAPSDQPLSSQTEAALCELIERSFGK